MDDQLLEMFGKHRLTESLLNADLEVAFPARDRGIDLIAYSDVNAQLGHFVGLPIQMKAASKACFSIDRKYFRFPDLLIAFVWNVSEAGNTKIYALSQREAVQIAAEMKYTATDSWNKKGSYVVTRPSPRLVEMLAPYEVNNARWAERIMSAGKRQPERRSQPTDVDELQNE